MPKRILIVDDDRDLTDLLADQCRHIGLEPVIAHNSLTAIFALQQQNVDLICMDVNMPTGDGLTICETILADRSVRCPIVIVTGRADQSTLRRCQDLCIYYVRKGPDLWSRLKPVIYELVDLPPESVPVGMAD